MLLVFWLFGRMFCSSFFFFMVFLLKEGPFCSNIALSVSEWLDDGQITDVFKVTVT